MRQPSLIPAHRPVGTSAFGRHSFILVAACLLGVSGLLVACGDDDGGTASSDEGRDTTSQPASTEPVIDPGDGGNYQPQIDPANFVTTVDNPYFPLTPGARWVYEGQSGDENERIEVVVTDQRRDVMGVSTTVVRDTVYLDGELAEDTFDWFAQDREGNVWYFGEDTQDYENGEVVSTEGAWEAGVDGALPGIVMLAEPTVGEAYRQEFYQGKAEDLGQVLEVGATHRIGPGEYQDVVVTEDWNPLDPEVVENKYYAPGVGLIYEVHTAGDEGVVELVEYTP